MCYSLSGDRMKKILYNIDNLKEEDINRSVLKAKALIINSKDEILFAHTKDSYFLIGGRVEEGESFDETLVREIKEETGVEIKLEERKPFITIIYMNKDYPNDGINTKTLANYYLIKQDIKPNIDKIMLTEEEKSWNFELKFIYKDDVLKKLNESLKKCKNKNAVKDTIEVIKEFLEVNK